MPLRELDFSHNSLRRLPDRLLAGVKGNLTKLVLADNLLGDNLNPIFSTAELHNLPALEELDLSGNSIRGLEEGLLIGCDVLKVNTLCLLHFIAKLPKPVNPYAWCTQYYFIYKYQQLSRSLKKILTHK